MRRPAVESPASPMFRARGGLWREDVPACVLSVCERACNLCVGDGDVLARETKALVAQGATSGADCLAGWLWMEREATHSSRLGGAGSRRGVPA
jgi:hypothetical protein